MTGKAWGVFVAAVFILFGGLIYMNMKNKIDVNSINEFSIQSASSLNGNIADHVFGNKDSKVILIEYGDYQCPGCAGAHPRLKTLSHKYKDHIAFVFRNLPLTSIHPNAKAAAAAAEAADKQGKFWEMHDLLYEAQDDWKSLGITERTNQFIQYAASLDLDKDTFVADLDAADIKQKIEFDKALADKSKATGTPSIYLNGEQVEQSVWGNDDALDAAIRDALKEKGVKLPKE